MAIKRLIENMNIVQSLVIPGLDSDMDVIQKLDDEPNDVGGLTAQQLKAEFDKAGNIVKRYINEILLPALSDTVAEAEEREKAETERKRNEILRQEAEQQRADETTGIVAQATQQANQAMESKNTAVAASKKAEQSAAEAHSDAGIVRESVSITQENAKQTSFDRESIKAALDNLPAGAVPVIDNLTTGGAAVALSAEQGRLLGELANLTDYPRALYNLGAAPGVNLLDNWYFVGGGGPGQFPVNQRGQMKYAGIGYGIDRWKSSTDSYFEITADGLTIASEGSQFGYGLIYQAIPASAWLIGRTVTLSVLMQGNLFTKSERIVDNPDAWNVSLSGGLARVYAVNQNVFFEFVVHPGSQFSGIQAVKLELGPTQTLAHQEGGKWVPNKIPNYAEQLARCQRYLFSAHDPIVPYACIGSGYIANDGKEGGKWVPNKIPNYAEQLARCQRYLFSAHDPIVPYACIGSGYIANDGTTAVIIIPLPVTLRTEQLARCQRYLFSAHDPIVPYACIGSGYIANDGTTAVIIIPLPVTLRTVPSIIVKGEIRIDMANGSIGFMTAKGVYNIGRGCTAIYGTVTNGTAGVPCYALLDTNDDVLLSAEL